MATKDVDVGLNIQAKTKGFKEAQRESSQLAQNLSPEKLTGGFQKLEHFIAQSTRQFRGLERHIKNMNQSLHAFSKAMSGVEKFADAMERASKAAEKTAQGTRKTGEEAKKLSPFVQGLLQGVGNVEFLQRPGGARQFAGRAVGATGRGIAGAGVGGVFSGLGGLSQGLAGIPGIGGALAGQLQIGAQAAQQFIGFQRTQLQLAPILGLRGAAKAGEAEVLSPRGQRAIAQASQRAALAAFEEVSAQAPTASRPRAGGGGMLGFSGDLGEMVATEAGRRDPDLAGALAGQAAGRRAERRAAAGLRRQGINRFLGLTGVRRAGLQLGGLNAQQALQFAGQVTQAGGGTLQEAQGQGAIRAALAAQTEFGVGAGVSGAFLRGARRGGIVGARGAGAGQSLVGAIEAAMSAGMDRTEVRDFLAQIAQGQQQFLQTGMPINPISIAGMTRGFRLAGLEQGRAGRLGGALAGRAQQVGEAGPQTAADFLLLQQVGGFQGGGLSDLESAQERLQNMEFGSPEFQSFIRSVSQGAGGGVAGRFALRNVLRGFGAQVGIREARALQAQAMGDPSALSEDERQAIERARTEISAAQEGRPRGLSGLESQARETVSLLAGTVKRQAQLDNQRLDVGAKLVTSIQNLESNVVATATAFAVFGPELQRVTGALSELSNELPNVARNLRTTFMGEGSR